MALRSHLSIGENEHRFRDVAEKLEARSINLFIGAGLSVPCGMRGWTAFLQLLAQKAFIEREVSGLLLDDKYEEAGELCYKRLGHEFFEEVLINEFGPAGISSERLNGAVKYLRDLQSVADSRLVITTNYDRVIEAVFRARGKNFAEVVPGGQPELLRRLVASGELCLLKLHGDVRNPVGRVLRKHDYENAYGTPDEHTVDVTLPLPNILFTIFQGRSLLFLGCSLGLDRTMGLLKMISEKYPFAPVHHAILENVFSTERDRAARDRDLLNNYKIAAIWYARGEHHCVPDLIRQLLKSVTGHVAQGLRPDWAAFAFGLDCAEDMLDRDDLCEVDFDAGKAIKPNKLESVLEIILSDGRPAAGKHVAISGIPGSGKSAFAAWIDYTLCEQGIPSVYCPGKQYQTQNDLTEKLATLPRNTVAIIDDVHLVPRQVEALRNTRAVNELCLVLLGRPAIFGLHPVWMTPA